MRRGTTAAHLQLASRWIDNQCYFMRVLKELHPHSPTPFHVFPVLNSIHTEFSVLFHKLKNRNRLRSYRRIQNKMREKELHYSI